MKEQIVVCMPLKNAETTVTKSIESFLSQHDTNRELILLIGNDGSTDESIQIVQSFMPHPQIHLLNVNFSKTCLCRNFLNEYVRKNYPDCVLIGRLDADDLIFDENTLSEIERLYDATDFDILICGDQQVKNGLVLDWVNKASAELLDNQYVLQKLKEMMEGDSKAELPSSNIFIKKNVQLDYPNVDSAEDHWFLVSILLNKKRFKIHIAENLIYCFYSLNGHTTRKNKKRKLYLKSRSDLYRYFKDQIEFK